MTVDTVDRPEVSVIDQSRDREGAVSTPACSSR